MHLDTAVYPDREPPETLETLEEKADYVHRICSAWDFGILPDESTFELLAGWRNVFERFPIFGSPAFDAFCERFAWPHGTGQIFRARYEVLDAREERTDPVRNLV
ncbi:MAG: hypothetical protein JO113_06040 [Candidatus Eremiobacteraeota bacterium]|nr:hypothetical protein [Candidatus Eremiobacteraeota bacterium]